MNKKYKIIKFLICALLISIVIILILLLIINKGNIVVPDEKKYSLEAENLYPEIKERFEKVKYRDQYYTVQTLIERYFTYINDSLYDESGIKDVSQEALYSIMDTTFLNEYHLENKNDLIKQYQNFQENESFDVEEMYVYQLSYNVNLYLVKGITILSNDSFNIFVKLDMLNSTFSMYPSKYLDKYNYSEESEDIDIKGNRIEENEYNNFKMMTVSDERMSVIYFNKVKNILLGNVNKAYDLLDKEYREKRFGTKEIFEKYIGNLKGDIAKIEISSYLVNTYTDYTEYVCKDQYENLYIFRETQPMVFTVMLDTYTLDNEKFLEKYNSSNDQYKVAMNIDKWVQMLNNRDYQSAFKVLDETFRKTNFDNDVDKFEEYMRQYFPEHYKLEFGEFSEETGTYMQEITLKDITGQDEKEISKTIYMELKEGTNFVMSFNLTRH